MTFKDFIYVDIFDWENWVALLIAIPLFYWGIWMLLK
jgi:hypothetical protein